MKYGSSSRRRKWNRMDYLLMQRSELCMLILLFEVREWLNPVYDGEKQTTAATSQVLSRTAFLCRSTKADSFPIHPNSLPNWASCGCRPFWCFARSLLSLQSWPFFLYLSWKPAVMSHVIPRVITVWWPPCPPLSASSYLWFPLLAHIEWLLSVTLRRTYMITVAQLG